MQLVLLFLVPMSLVAICSSYQAAPQNQLPCPCPHWCKPALLFNQPLLGTITVSKTPGFANCTTIQGAVELTRQGYRDRYTIEVEPGCYTEKLIIQANMPPITLVGMTRGVADGVIVQWNDQDHQASTSDPIGEWFDQTLWVGAADFRVEIRSFAGGKGSGRNMAAQVAADRAYFRNCRFYGSGADTLYIGGMDHRAYFEQCYVNGTDDFLWGVGSSVFVECEIVGTSTITAHKGTQVDRNGVLGGCKGDDLLGHSCTALLLLNCRIPRPPGFRGMGSLGRPWRWMATVVFKSCWMDDHIPAVGWTLPGNVKDRAANLTFAEYNTTGPGARPSRPFPAQMFSAAEAATWTVSRVLKGWDPLVAAQQPYCWDSAVGCQGDSGVSIV